MLIALLACSCEQSNQHQISVSKTGLMSSQVPADLRTLSVSGLRVVVAVDGESKVYEAIADQHGTWEVPVDFESNTTYQLNIKWFVGDVLVLEEIASVLADPENRSIKVEPGIFITTGYPRFDDDCDGISNYSEFKAGTDPGPVANTLGYQCENSYDASNNVLGSTGRGTIYTHFPNAFSLDPSPISRVEFPLYVHTLTDARNTEVELRVATQDWEVDNEFYFSLSLLNQPSIGKSVEFNVSTLKDDDTLRFEQPCKWSKFELVVCEVPYQWKERHWYTLALYQLGSDAWRAALIDSSTSEEIALGTVSFASARAVRLTYASAVLTTRHDWECADGLPPTAIMLKSPKADNFAIDFYINALLPAEFTRASLFDVLVYKDGCLTSGGGWSAGTRTYDGEIIHSIVVGQYDK